jgi:hypothetical protein
MLNFYTSEYLFSVVCFCPVCSCVFVLFRAEFFALVLAFQLALVLLSQHISEQLLSFVELSWQNCPYSRHDGIKEEKKGRLPLILNLGSS